MNLSGRTVLLTGATGGIGHAIARALAARGASLVLTGRRADVLEPLAAETGGRAVPCDLTDRAALDALCADFADADALVANAALPASGPLPEFTPQELDRALDVNLRAPMMLARAMSARMVARGGGHLVFISSLSGKAPAPGSSVYAATKFGLRGLALGLREDLHGSGVGVSAVFPGFVRDAGLFADTGLELPWFVGTSTADQVARAVVRAIERNRGEIDVAPLPMRVGTRLSLVAPASVVRLQRWLGSHDVARDMAAAQRGKR